MNDDRWYRFGVGWTGGLLGAGVLLAIGREVVPDVLALTEARGHDRIIVAAALLSGTAAAWLAGAHFLGPIAASAARQRWEIDADPVRWQRGAARRLVPVMLVTATVVGTVIGLAAGDSNARAVGVGAVAVAALMAMSMGAVHAQRRDIGPHAVGWVASVALALLTAAAWGPIFGVLVGVVAVAGATRRAGPWRWRQGGLVPRWNLAAAAARRASAYTATLLMEAPARPATSGDRRAVARLPATGAGRLAVIGMWRAASRVGVTIGVGLLVATVSAELLGRPAGVAAVVVVLHLTTGTATRVLLAWWTSESVRRTLALPTRPTRVALSVPACAATFVTVGLAVPLLTLAIGEVVALLLLPVLATWSRVSTAAAADQLVMMSTPMGAVPIQTVTRTLSGVDATILVLMALLVIGQA